MNCLMIHCSIYIDKTALTRIKTSPRIHWYNTRFMSYMLYTILISNILLSLVVKLARSQFAVGWCLRRHQEVVIFAERIYS